MLAGNSISRPLEKTPAPMFPTAARKYYREKVQLIAIRNWVENFGSGILTGYGRPFWKGLEHNGFAGNGITVSRTMETLYAPTRGTPNLKREREKESAAIINLFTYLYIPQSVFLFLPLWNEARFYVQMLNKGYSSVALDPFCRNRRWTLKNTLILLFGGNFEFNSIAINYSSVVKGMQF